VALVKRAPLEGHREGLETPARRLAGIVQDGGRIQAATRPHAQGNVGNQLLAHGGAQQSIQFLLSPAGERQLQSLSDSLGKFGISKGQVIQFENQLLAQVQSALSGLLPFLIVFFSNLINLVLVVTLSVYFVIDGPRIVRWLRLKTPVAQRDTINFLLSDLDQSLGGYFRGSLLQALIGALGTGVGLALYAYRNFMGEPARIPVGAGALGRVAGGLRRLFREFF